MATVEEKEFAPAQLVEEAKGGLTESFEQLVTCYEKRVFAYLCQLTRNKHDAEDLTQDTFVKAYQNLHRFDPRMPFGPWLFTIAKRTALNHFRDARPVAEYQPSDEVDVVEENPSVLLEQKDQRESIWNLARKLKPNQFEVLWLRYGEGFSTAEISRIMGLNLIYVKVLLHRARNELVKRLAGADGAAGPDLNLKNFDAKKRGEL